MSLELTILYRGPLSSCNYECGYCPFAKRHETAAELAVDRTALERFAEWVEAHGDVTQRILFTPWGEALTRRWYRTTLARLSRLPHVRRVAIQTNLSAPLDWLDDADRERLALWCTYHPSQVARDEFLSQCRELDRRGVRYSVGMVGLKERHAEIEQMRAALSPHVYLWINAYKDVAAYDEVDDVERLTRIDPLFGLNYQRHASLDRPCRAGESAISVDGDGQVRRCHFVPELLGNLYRDSLEAMLRPRSCPRAECNCYIGYMHMPELGLDALYGDGVLERIPRAEVRDAWSDS